MINLIRKVKMSPTRKKYICVLLIVLSLATLFYCISGAHNNEVDKQILYKHGIDTDCWAYTDHSNDINILPLWRNDVVRNSSLIVAVVDSGVYDKSSVIKSNYWYQDKNRGEQAVKGNNRYGWDFFNGDDTIFDGYSTDYHGTYIANEIERVNNDAIIMSCKFMSGTKGDASDACDAINFAISNGAKIINCSWSIMEDVREMHDLIKQHPDVLFVCSAGNNSLNLDESPIYPACYSEDNIITVGAICKNGEPYGYSGFGNTNVDIYAPGEGIDVIMPENDIDKAEGTSIACAYVSGAASILMSNFPQLSASEIRKVLIDSAKENKNLNGLCASRGTLNVYRSYLICRRHL